MKESAFQFQNPKVKSIEFRISETYNPNQKFNFANRFDTKITRYSDDSKHALVELIVKIGEEGSENPPFSVLMIIGAMFKWDEGYDDGTISRLLSINAPTLLLGYARPIIAYITSTSGFASYNIPFINFTPERI